MRTSGILMHISSLPSPYGIGTMGKEARKFVDFLDKSDYLCKDKLLTKKECLSYEWGENPEFVEYGTLYENRFPLLKKAYQRFKKALPDDFADFCEKNSDWLEDYALFMAFKTP